MNEKARIAIEELDDIETLVAVHGARHLLDSTGHLCFAIAAAIASYQN